MIKIILFIVLFTILAGLVVFTIFKGHKYSNRDISNSQYYKDIEAIEQKYKYELDKTSSWDHKNREKIRDECQQEIDNYKSSHVPPKPEGKLGFILGFVGLLVTLIVILCVPGSFHQVDTGTVAVVRHLGKIEGIRQPGTYFDFYMVKKYEIYDTKVQQDKILTAAYSKDGQTMELEVFLQYQVQSENIMKIATEYGNLDALQARIETVAIEKTKAVMSSAEAMTIIQNRSIYSTNVSSSVRDGISADYYVNVKDVILTNIDFTNEFERSVENKVIAEQEKQAAITRAEAELEVAKLEAQKKIEEARGNAEAQKILAKASAEAATYNIVELAKVIGYTVNETYLYSVDGIETETAIKQAETDTIIYLGTKYVIDIATGPGVDKFKELVEDYLAYLAYLEKWNGELPNVVAGDDSLSIIVP